MSQDLEQGARIDQQVVVLTGLSGGGKTAAAKLFEDLGYVVVDNLPGELLRDLADLVATEPVRYARTAIVLDVRTGDVPLAFGAMRGALEGRGIRPVIIFLEARDDVLIRRFSETRHRHPLADERGIAASIALERAMLDSVRAQADVVLDTSDLSLRELRERIFARLGDVQGSDRLSIQLISFGFKYGVPLEADLVLDVRFMKNPHYIEALRPLSGLTDEVREYVLAQPVADAFLARLQDLLDLLVPAYVEEGKTRLTIAIGCTGGCHRSVVMSEELARLAARAGLRSGVRLPPGARAVNLRRWLTVGIGVKRWLLLAFLGLLVLAIGVAHVIRQVMADAEPGGPIRSAVDVRDPPVPAVPAARPGCRRARPGPLPATARTASCARWWIRSPCGTATSRWSRSSTRSGSWPAGRASSRSVAGRACRPSCAASRSTPRTSRRWSPSPTTGDRRACCAPSSGSRPSATSATASSPSRTRSR